MNYCTCRETLLTNEDGQEVRVPKPPHHCCEYIATRSALVPRAERIADDLTDPRLLDEMAVMPDGSEPGRGEGRKCKHVHYGVVWTQNFSAAMEELVRGQRNGNVQN